MFASFNRITLLVCVLLLVSCAPKPKVFHQQLLVFGTIVDIKIWDIDETKGQQIIAQLDDDFKYMHRAWHAWHAGPLTRTNYFLARGESLTASPSSFPLIIRSTKLSALSGGLFNPAIGKSRF